LGGGGTTTQGEEEKSTTMVLGLIWDKKSDTLSCEIATYDQIEKTTKRSVLSAVHKIYDPIGFLCPVLLQPKLLLQKAWETKTGWDKELPDEESRKFMKWTEELHHLKEVKIPRQMIENNMNCDNIQIHVFGDASKDAYATVIFIRSGSECVKVQLVQAKARVAPLRRPTIPRLELMACVIGVRLVETVKEALGYEKIPTTFWSDSTTALAWIKRNDCWGTFVGNRVKEILKYSEPSQWKHVPGHLNPADLPSRGCNAKTLHDSGWWEGPEWLSMSEENWPNFEEVVDEDEVKEEMKKSSIQSASSIEEIQEPRFSSYRKNVAVIGWIRRFSSNCQKKRMDRISNNYLSISEMRGAEKYVLKDIQSTFSNKLKEVSIKNVKMEDGLYRVHTKLLYRNDTEGFKYPVLLPKSHPLVEQLIRDAHRIHGHAGIQFLMGHLREKYWILQGRRTIGKVIQKCVKCSRHQIKNVNPNTPAPLPEKRVENSVPFQTTGVDLAGPFFLKDGRKAWMVIFTCAVFRAIHLDLVMEISTEAFMEALERFINHHGRMNTIFSDHGTNFVGAANLFKRLDWMKIEKMSNVKQIQWIFNPPTAAWWGGWWERLIRSIKDLLKRMLGNAKLSYDGLRTCISSAAATINNRPLTTVNEDNDDLIPLTPAMFLMGSRKFEFPEGKAISARALSGEYSKSKQLQEMLQARFRKEYLAALVHRSQEKNTPQPKEGDIVLIGADNKKRYEWPLGKVLELMPGKDGVVRVARVKTSKGILLRPLQRLYLLEVPNPSDIPPSPIKIHDEIVEEVNEPEVKTRSGRVIKKPQKYVSWNK
jgi:hypothetical protein